MCMFAGSIVCYYCAVNIYTFDAESALLEWPSHCHWDQPTAFPAPAATNHAVRKSSVLIQSSCVAQIWSTQTAQLLRSCRGHDGEVTDLAVNLNSTIVASSSNDTTIRCWSLQVQCFTLIKLSSSYAAVARNSKALSVAQLFACSLSSMASPLLKSAGRPRHRLEQSAYHIGI